MWQPGTGGGLHLAKRGATFINFLIIYNIKILFLLTLCKKIGQLWSNLILEKGGKAAKRDT
jgi:hypothetical protein